MTMLLIDGFDYGFNNTIALAQGWVGDLPAVNTSTAFSYGSSIRPSYDATLATSYRYIRKRVVDSEQSVIGFRCNVANEPAGTGSYYWYVGVYDANTGTRPWYIKFSVFGTITIYNNAGTLIASSDPDLYTPGGWFYIEIKSKTNNTGMIEIRVNTVPVITLPVVDLSPVGVGLGGWTHFRMDAKSTLGYSPVNLIDDLYILDDNGTVNNDFLGNVRVKSMAPVSDATPLDFSIGGSAPAATNWQSVLNSSLNDTKYVYSPNIGDRDLYNVNPILNTPYVHAIEVDGAFRQDDATQMFAQNTIQTGTGVDDFGPSFALSESYRVYVSMYELNPDTGVAFTGAEANALKIGPQVAAS